MRRNWPFLLSSTTFDTAGGCGRGFDGHSSRLSTVNGTMRIAAALLPQLITLDNGFGSVLRTFPYGHFLESWLPVTLAPTRSLLSSVPRQSDSGSQLPGASTQRFTSLGSSRSVAILCASHPFPHPPPGSWTVTRPTRSSGTLTCAAAVVVPSN